MATLDPQLRAVIDAYFTAMNERDEAAFTAILGDGVVFFGSMAGVRIQGVDAVRGMFQAVVQKFPGVQQNAGRSFGPGPELAVMVELSYEGDSTEGIWVFRFDGAGKLARVSALYDPQPFQLKRTRGTTNPGLKLDEAFPPTPLDPATRGPVDAYFETFNAGDEEAHMRLFDPESHFFGSMSGIDSAGLSTLRGVFHAGRSAMGIRRLNPVHYYGRRQELAVRLTFAAEGATGSPAEGVWAFRINEKGLIDRLSALWNPAFLPR